MSGALSNKTVAVQGRKEDLLIPVAVQAGCMDSSDSFSERILSGYCSHLEYSKPWINLCRCHELQCWRGIVRCAASMMVINCM